MKDSKRKVAWKNCDVCDCGEKSCHPNNHRLCGICGNQGNKDYLDRRIMYGSYNDPNSRYGWNVDHKRPISIGGTDKNSNLRAAHIKCNSNRGNN